MEAFMEAYPMLGAFIFTMIGIGIGFIVSRSIRKRK